MQKSKKQLNPELIKMLCELDDGRFFGELVDIFLTHSPQLIEELESAVRNEEHESQVIVAHKFKGSCANIGAERLAELASFLENGPINLSTMDKLALVTRIYHEFSGVKQALETFVKIQKGQLEHTDSHPADA